MIEKIDAGTAIRLLDAGKAVAVDVREADEYAVGHIPGAKLLPLGEVNSRAAEVLPEKEATWLVYCRTGRRLSLIHIWSASARSTRRCPRCCWAPALS